MYARPQRQSGFTLVEVSVVLVVIALIIGGVFVATNVMQNARVTSTINTLQSIQAAVSTYNQNYGALPGDDNRAVARFGVANNGGGNGIVGAATLAASFNDTTTTLASANGAAESRIVWSHLRASGLIKGDAADVAQPSNPFGGVYGIQNGAFTTGQGFALGTNVICISNIPGDAGIIIDQRQDDGDALTGNIRAGAAVTGDTSAYVNANTYVLCTRAL